MPHTPFPEQPCSGLGLAVYTRPCGAPSCCRQRRGSLLLLVVLFRLLLLLTAARPPGMHSFSCQGTRCAAVSCCGREGMH